MPRRPRDTEPGTIYHLISRFVDRDWYISNDEERAYYLRLFGNAAADSDWSTLGYALMSNHIHLATVAGTVPLDRWIRRVHSPFADWLNRKHDRIGTIFVRGPKQRAVNPDGVGQLLAYIHNNPVRAGVVSDASDSPWTSHRAYLNTANPPTWLSVDLGLRLAGFADRATFDAFVRLHPKDPERARLQTAIDDPEERQIFHRPAEPQLDPVNVVRAAAVVLGLEPATLRTRRRSQQHVFARHVAVVAADRVGLSGAQIARALGLSQQGASVIVNRPASDEIVAAVDRVVSRLESVHKGGRKR